MKTNRCPLSFSIRDIDWFDARKGYKSCDPSSIGVGVGGRRETPRALFWWNKEGDLVGQMRCAGETFCFEAKRQDGSRIRQEDLIAFQEYMSEVLLDWIVEGIHEVDGIFELRT